MSEMTNPIPTEETVQETSEGFETGESAEADDWDDIDLSDVKDNDPDADEGEGEDTPADPQENPEADQQKEETEDKPGEDTAHENNQTEEQEEADQPTFDLKFMGEIKKVDKEEVVRLAQKGLNYDRILEERNTAKTEISRLQEYESFLQELAGPDNMTVEDLIDSTRAEILAKKEGVDSAVALQRIKLDRDKRAFETQKSQEQAEQRAKQAAEERQQEDFRKFVRAYPGVKAQDIPAEVWQKVRDGIPLVTAYSQHENKMLREENAALKAKVETAEQNKKNEERSTGSQSSAGKSSKKDILDELWYDGT